MEIKKYLLSAFAVLCFSAAAQADNLERRPHYKGLLQNEDFQVLEFAVMPADHISTEYLSLTQEETINRYYLKMLDRYTTDDEHAQFAYYMHWEDCTTNYLGYWVMRIFKDQEFKDILPSASTDPYQRASQLVRRIYKAALARSPDSGGFRFYRDKIYSRQMTERNFVLQIVGSQEFKDGTPAWCASR